MVTTIDYMNSPLRIILDIIGNKWNVPILLNLNENPKLRFNELQKKTGSVSQKMLTLSLKTLEENGLITRTIYSEIPPRVEYQLTEQGRKLVPLIGKLEEWAIENNKLNHKKE